MVPAQGSRAPYQRLPSALWPETRDLKVAKTVPCSPSRGKQLTTATF